MRQKTARSYCNLGRRAAAFLGCWMALAISTPVSAATLLDTTPVDTGSGRAFEYQHPSFAPTEIAVEFTTASAVIITDVQAYITADRGALILGIVQDSGGEPASEFDFLYSSVVSSFPSSNSNPVDLSSLDWAIGPGTYWLVASTYTASSFVGTWWFASDAGVTPTKSYYAGAQVGTWVEDNTMAALIVATDVSATPVPSAFPLFATGLGAFGLIARRRRRGARTA